MPQESRPQIRIKHRFFCHHKNEKLLKELSRLGVPFKFDDVDPRTSIQLSSLEFFLYEDEPDYELRRARLRPYTDLLVKEMTEFSNQEIERSQWFWFRTFQTGYPQPDERYLEVTYDMSRSCSHCSVDKSQKAPFRFWAEPKSKHSHFIGLHWVFDEVFMRPKAVELITAEGLTGLRFSQALLHKTGEPLSSVVQAHVDTVLSAGLIIDNLSLELCQSRTDGSQILGYSPPESAPCGRSKFHAPTRGGLMFHQTSLNNQPDFIRTSAWFGSGGVAFRPILVSKRVRDLVLRSRLRGAHFEPVLLIDA